jgi:hypothetical protein
MKRTPLKRRIPLKTASKKRALELRRYYELRQGFLTDYPICQGCGRNRSTEVHHTKGRYGRRLNQMEYWLALCHWCHSKLHHQS